MTIHAGVDDIADFLYSCRAESIAQEARNAAKIFLLDSIGVGLSGYPLASAMAVRRAVADWGNGSSATVLGGGEAMPATSAAYINSFQIHCQEFDCLHEPATVHAMAVLGGALLAVAEEYRYSGKDLIFAVVLGVETAVTLGLSARNALRFFRPATAGALGATAAIARLAGFDREQFKNAWGICYSQLAGTMQAHVEGSVALPLQVAAAARNAVSSIQLARQGLGGPHDILLGPYGYFRLFEDREQLGDILPSLGSTWRVTELSHKPFPTGRAAHGTLDALQQLQRAQPFELDDVSAIDAWVPPLVKRLVDRPAGPGMTTNYARLCLQFLAPVFLKYGTINTSSFSKELRDDPQLQEHSAKVTVHDDGNSDVNALAPQRITVRLRDGTVLEKHIAHTIGSPENPLTREQYLAKFHRCAEDAGIGESRAKRLVRLLENLDAVSDVREMTALCTPG